MKILKNGPQKLLIIGPNLFFTVQPSPQPTAPELIFHLINMSQDSSVSSFVPLGPGPRQNVGPVRVKIRNILSKQRIFKKSHVTTKPFTTNTNQTFKARNTTFFFKFLKKRKKKNISVF